jgi:hypothetical protein
MVRWWLDTVVSVLILTEIEVGFFWRRCPNASDRLCLVTIREALLVRNRVAAHLAAEIA